MSDAGATERAALRDLGDEWGRALSGRESELRALPVDPGLEAKPQRRISKRNRFGSVDFVAAGSPQEIEATAEAEGIPGRFGSVVLFLRRHILGPPLAATAVASERMRKLVALPVLS